MQCNATQRNATQRIATQCNAMQCNAMKCNAMQCNVRSRRTRLATRVTPRTHRAMKPPAHTRRTGGDEPRGANAPPASGAQRGDDWQIERRAASKRRDFLRTPAPPRASRTSAAPERRARPQERLHVVQHAREDAERRQLAVAARAKRRAPSSSTGARGVRETTRRYQAAPMERPEGETKGGGAISEALRRRDGAERKFVLLPPSPNARE